MRTFLFVATLVTNLRARHAIGVGIVLACAVVFAFEIGLVFAFPLRPIPGDFALGALFLGPSSLPHEPPFRATEIFSDPIHHLGTAALGALGARSAFARSGPRRPETDAAIRFDAAGLRFVAVAVLHALLSVSGILGRVLWG